MKKLVSISVATLTFAIQGVALAQSNQGSPITSDEYNIIISVVCDHPEELSEIEVETQVAYELNSSINDEKPQIAGDMVSLPQIEKDRMCLD